MGPLGPLYFAGVYVLAECLAFPATPLTLSAGYIFGPPLGIFLVLLSGGIAATIGFHLSRTFMRPWVTRIAAKNTVYQKINRAVEREGFKIIFLLRLSPLMPFSLSNYLLGLSSVGFRDFLVASLLGFAPGTCTYAYIASTARTVMREGTKAPWYIYVLMLVATGLLLRLVAEIARRAVEESVDGDTRTAVASPA